VCGVGDDTYVRVYVRVYGEEGEWWRVNMGYGMGVIKMNNICLDLTNIILVN
jgi:hypothetical protein